MSREAWGDPPDPEPQRCPVCDGEWHAEDCEFGKEVFRRLKAESEAMALRGQLGAASGWIVEALKVLDTVDPEDTAEADELHKLIKAGEVLALTTLASSKAPEFECLGEPSLCANPRGCACVPDSKTPNARLSGAGTASA